MTTRHALRAALALLATLLLSSAANAQLFRTYLAPTGSDGNPCTLPLPCRLLPAALAAVADGGEIWMLDSANYNTATVTVGKSVTILAVPGAVGSVLAIGGPAISITTAGLKVALRNLVIVPLPGGGGTHGIQLAAASSLAVEDCLIANHAQNGIVAGGGATLSVTGSTLRGNNQGLELGGLRFSISGSRLIGNTVVGLFAYGTTGGTTGAISDSVVTGGAIGIQVFALGNSSRVSVVRTTVQGAATGIRATANNTGVAVATLSGSALAGNVQSWGIYPGTGTAGITTLGNNHIAYSDTPSDGTLTTGGLQ